jgi:gluconate 5-dehydrogenase
MNFSLAGKTALVTGAARGIGLALGLGLAEAGAKVIFTGRDVAALPAGQAVARLDVADFAGIQAAVQEITAAHGVIDILINNAGVEDVCPSLDVTEALWDKIVGTNLKGAFFVAQAVALQMPAGGTILNVCSLTSEVGVPGAAAYGASKSGLVGLTRALATEWAPRGIRVNGIGPGYFRTALTEVFYQNEAWAEGMKSKIPLGRFGAMADLTGPAVFLCAEAARYVTGQVLYVDGGYLAAI